MKERIQKILANAGVASRRAIEEMVLQGRISVNGHIVTKLPVLIDVAQDKVEVDGEVVRVQARREGKRVYLLMHKPKGVYTTNVAQGEQTRAIDLLPPDLGARVYPVGRLDADAKGLLLLTNDGELTNRLTHPRYGVAKTYRAIVDGFVDPAKIQELERGIWMSDSRSGKGFKTGRCQIRVSTRNERMSVLEITLREGRTGQVRRMLARVGHKVRDLTRVRLGPLTIKGLGIGQVRTLTPWEIKELWRAGEIPAGGNRGEKGERRE